MNGKNKNRRLSSNTFSVAHVKDAASAFFGKRNMQKKMAPQCVTLTVAIHGLHIAAVGGDAAGGGGHCRSGGTGFDVLAAAGCTPRVSRYCRTSCCLLPAPRFILHHLLLTASCHTVPRRRAATPTATGGRRLRCLLLC
jgi:hypothetical protein